MDISAVISATDDVLKEMGLTTAGDRLSLRRFCNHNSQDMEKNKDGRKRLLEAFLSSKKDKSKKLETSGKQGHKRKLEEQKTKRVQMGWKHFREEDQIYYQVPLAKGGGSRHEIMALTSNKMDVLRLLKSTFFPNGESCHGKIEEMEFCIGNFQNVKMGATLQVNGREVPFSIGNYLEAFKLKDARLYLLSKKIVNYSSSEESDEDDLRPMISVDDFIPSTLPSTGSSKRSCTGNTCGSTENKEDYKDSLLGTTKERSSLKREQDKAYEQSLEADKQKRIALETTKEQTKHKQRVQEARAARVLPEPETDFVTVRVRHPTMGLCSRRFPTNSHMSAVYDWAGSLSPEIVDFTLCDPLGGTLSPSRRVDDKCTILMTSTPNTPSLSLSDDEVQFNGFGASMDDSSNTTQDCEPNIKETERDTER